MTSVRSVPVLVLVVMAITPCVFADVGGLSGDDIAKIRGSFEMDAHSRVMYNSITNTSITDLALNRDIVLGHDEHFSHKIKTKGITNQKSSGRCWLFAGLNMLRPAALEKYNLKEFELSQNYLSFWDKLEKANCFLENIIEFRKRDMMDREMEFILRNPISDGGYWENVVNLVEKYGAVPSDIMPETNSSSSTRSMNKLIGRKLRADAAKLREMAAEKKGVKKLRATKAKMLADVYKMLVLNLGEPPEKFEWRFEDANSVVSEPKTYTPKEFYAEFVGVDVRDYVDIFNDPSKEYGRHYSISLTRNIRDGEDNHFANVKMDVLKAIALKSVLDDEPVWFGCDVGKDQSGDHGIMAIGMWDYDSIYGVDMGMTKAQRSLFRESVPNHAMVFTGVDLRDEKPVKWLVENSWGKDKGSDGMWTLYDSWFDTYVYSVMVKKKYVPKDVLKIYEQPAKKMPVWDPAWAFTQ